MKTKTAAFVAALLFLGGGILVTASQDASEKAVDYLKNQPLNAWTVMALASVGEVPGDLSFLNGITSSNAIDYAAPIMALTSAAADPFNVAGEDYVAKLESFWDGNQLGSAQVINDDIFGLMALTSAGKDQNNFIVSGIRQYLISQQNSDGGWGWAIGGSSDSNMTAGALMALISAGENIASDEIQQAKTYLHSIQNSDGGFPYDGISDWGKTSDAASDAWVVSAIYALRENPEGWTREENNPVQHLISLQDDQGFFPHEAGGQATSFTPVETAYALIALEKEYYPVKIFSRHSFPFRIEGSGATICEGKVPGPSALDIVKNAAVQCGFTYTIKDTSWGPYLETIGQDVAHDLSGWLYFVNYSSPSVGAADYTLQSGDEVIWSFGNWDVQPLKLTLSKSDISVSFKVERFLNGLWAGVQDVIIRLNDTTDLPATDAEGNTAVVLSSLNEGLYKAVATKEGFVRSQALLLTAGTVESDHQVDVTVNITGQGQEPPPDAGIGFSVTPDSLDFGSMSPGDSASLSLTVENKGDIGITFGAEVTGSQIFRENLKLDQVFWNSFSRTLQAEHSQRVSAGLFIPLNWTGSFGQQEGQITLWAIP